MPGDPEPPLFFPLSFPFPCRTDSGPGRQHAGVFQAWATEHPQCWETPVTSSLGPRTNPGWPGGVPVALRQDSSMAVGPQRPTQQVPPDTIPMWRLWKLLATEQSVWAGLVPQAPLPLPSLPTVVDWGFTGAQSPENRASCCPIHHQNQTPQSPLPPPSNPFIRGALANCSGWEGVG